MIRICIIATLIIAGLSGKAQEPVRVKGTAQVRVEDHMSKDEAMEEAKHLAMINAIENKFGSYIEQDSDVDIENGKTDFKIIGHTRVRGDWLKTTNEKYREDHKRDRGRKKKNRDTWITCDITGLVREIRHPETILEFTPLNCRDALCRTYDFKDGESMYLMFRTPREGYLTIFAVQDNNMAYRLLPYQTMPKPYQQALPVEAGKAYLFFSDEKQYDYFPGFSYLMADELKMTTDKYKEYLDLYVIFSTNRYHKPLLKEPDESGDLIVPRSLTREGFEEWLLDNRIYDPSLIYKRITLTIQK